MAWPPCAAVAFSVVMFRPQPPRVSPSLPCPPLYQFQPMTPWTIVVAVALSSHACITCTWPVSGLATMSTMRASLPPTA